MSLITTCSARTPIASSSSAKVRQSREQSFRKYLRFAETVNGRSAMQGVAWAAVEAASHGAHRFEALDAVAVTGLVALGTAFTYSDEETVEWGPFTRKAELQNGRGSMIAMAGWLVARSQGML